MKKSVLETVEHKKDETRFAPYWNPLLYITRVLMKCDVIILHLFAIEINLLILWLTVIKAKWQNRLPISQC